jgi:hypothetical protein
MGKPPLANPGGSIAESIGDVKTTQGSEPSQYLQEEKTIVIPLVAASERGTAQTIVLARWGCRARHTELQTNNLVERSGTIGHRR